MATPKPVKYNPATLFEQGESLLPGSQPLSHSPGSCGNPSDHTSHQGLWGQGFLTERGLSQAVEKPPDGLSTIGWF